MAESESLKLVNEGFDALWTHMEKKLDGFEQREQAATFGYWSDPRWKIVNKLRKEGHCAKANNLVFKIRDDYGVD